MYCFEDKSITYCMNYFSEEKKRKNTCNTTKIHLCYNWLVKKILSFDMRSFMIMVNYPEVSTVLSKR